MFLSTAKICGEEQRHSRLEVCAREKMITLNVYSHVTAQVTSQVEVFKKHLEKFAAEHKNDIKSKPDFRAQFQQMCARIGVDPLACELYAQINSVSFCISHYSK